jgi:PDZ domain-containing protein
MLLVVPTQYAAITPGGLTNLKESFTIDGYEMDDHFYSIYVYSQEPLTTFQYYLLKNNENVSITDITKRQEDTSILDSIKQGNISKVVSYKTAMIKAYELASEQNNDIYADYDYEGLIIYDYPRRIDALSIGDIIIGIDGHSLEDEDFISSKDLAYKADVTYTILNENGDVFDYHYIYEEEDVLFWFFPSYTIIDAFPNFDFDEINLVGGSSGGLLQTLSIYVSLVNINLLDVKISGTGTIEMTGNVGLIGGIRQKIITAERENVDVFFIPYDHIDDIVGLEYSFELVPVNTLNEAVNWLNENIVS